MRTIAQNICYYRNKKQLTQQQLADKLNVSHHTISKWECGNNIPSVEDLKQLAQIFGLTLDELTNDNDKLAIKDGINVITVSGVFFETIVRIIKQTGGRWPFEHGNITKLAFEKVCIRLLAFSFTKYTNADLRLFEFARHYSTSSISTLGVAPYLPRRYPLRMFSVVRVEKSLMLYNSETPSSLFLSTK